MRNPKLAHILAMLISHAAKKKKKDKEVDPNAAKIKKCLKEEKKLAKCVSKGTYVVDFEVTLLSQPFTIVLQGRTIVSVVELWEGIQ